MLYAMEPRADAPPPSAAVAVLAFGSLISDPGVEIEPLISERRKVATPFPVEFSRFSGSRDGAPTLVPIDTGGAPVTAELLVLDPKVTIDEAKSLLWRRETRQENSGKKYVEPANPGPNNVLVNTTAAMAGVDTILYVDFPASGKIGVPTAAQLAQAAVESARRRSDGRDGISYLIEAKTSGIVTPHARVRSADPRSHRCIESRGRA